MSTASSRGFWPLRDLPVAIWLALLLVATFVHQWLPAPRWLMIHLLLLGAVTHAILVWSQYFAAALLRLPPRPGERRLQSARLVLLNLSALTVFAGVLANRWEVTTAGAIGVGAAVLWHGSDLFLRFRRSMPSRFGTTVLYYVAAAAFLPVGAGLGALLAHGLADPGHEQVKLAHAALNLLGWMGLTVAGTLVTLWPTMLRTRVAEGAEVAARRALPVLAVAALVTAAGAISGLLLLAAAGLVGYLGGLGLLAGPFVRAARTKPPTVFPTWSVLAAVTWWVGVLAALAVGLATAEDWLGAADRFGALSPFLAAGFGAQVLLGALSYLVPVVLGGGPSAVRAANETLDRGAAMRLSTVNAGLLVCVLPVPSVVRVAASLVVVIALAAFLPLLVLAIRASHRAQQVPVEQRSRGGRSAAVDRPAGQRAGQAVTGLAVVVLAVAAGVAIDPLALGTAGTSAAGGVEATGETTTVRVEAIDMRFHPSTISVPAGDRLVIELVNTDPAEVHDLVLDSGARSGRLAPGGSTVLDVGVVGRDLDGWCSVVGHRQMGMVLDVEVVGGATDVPAGDEDAAGHHGQHGAPDGRGSADHVPLDLAADPGDGFEAYDAVLPELGPDTGPQTHRHTFTVTEQANEVAPGVTQTLWTFNGTAPGPVLHGRVGDVFEITLVNDGSMGHSIDFHAGALAPDEPMRTIPPGESLEYRFEATRAGAWMYHCSTMPMTAHIANGMFGTVIIEPRELPEVDRSYVLTQSELYLGADGGPVDVTKLADERPDLVVFNGYANQYDHQPLPARVGERVRVWVLDAGPNRATSFHVVGGQFDTVWSEGDYRLRPDDPGAGGSQALGLQPAQGGFVELVFPEAGHYPFVSHVMIDAERGAHGVFKVRD